MSDVWRLYISGSGKPEKNDTYVDFWMKSERSSQRDKSSVIQIPGTRGGVTHFGGIEGRQFRVDGMIKLDTNETIDEVERGLDRLRFNQRVVRHQKCSTESDLKGNPLDFYRLTGSETISYVDKIETLKMTASRRNDNHAWCKPSVYYKGKTHYVYMGVNPGVSSYGHHGITYNHSAGTWSDPIKIDDWASGGSPPGSDSHCATTLCEDKDGYVHMFYNCHGNSTPGMQYKKTINSNDISTWSAAITFSGVATYPHAYLGIDDVIYVFHRGNTSENTTHCLERSTDSGTTWESRIVIVTMSDAAYFLAACLGKETTGTPSLHIAGYHYYGGRKKDVYYAKSLDGGVTWMKSDGTTLSIPMTTATMEKLHTSTYDSFPGGLDVDSRGYPYITYGDKTSSGDFTHPCILIQRNENTWENITLSPLHTTSQYPKIYIDEKDYIHVFSVGDNTSSYEGGTMFHWHSGDSGKNWDFETLTYGTFTSGEPTIVKSFGRNQKMLDIWFGDRVAATDSGINYLHMAYPTERTYVALNDFNIDKSGGRKNYYPIRLNLTEVTD
jgi:hypothetical protein